MFFPGVNIFMDLVDHAVNKAINFTGQYRLFVVGFGMGAPSQIARFDAEDIATYNTDFEDG